MRTATARHRNVGLWRTVVVILAGVTPYVVIRATRSAQPPRPAAQRNTLDAHAAYRQLPLHFEANHGQTDAPVKFLARGRGYTLFLTPTESVLALHTAPRTSPTVVRLTFAGSNPTPAVVGQEPLPDSVNYFLGHDPAIWQRDVPLYAKVVYHDLYPGVNLVYYGTQGHLEYDLVLASGVDPNIVALSIDGAQRLTLEANGDLLLHTIHGVLRQHLPTVFQRIGEETRRIPSRYLLKNNRQVGFQLARYDASHPVVIDPVLEYSTYLGGSEDDDGRAIAVDSADQVYVTGRTESRDFPRHNPRQPTGGGDAFVTKFRADGSGLIYSTYLGGTSGSEVGTAIAVDASGSAYVTGVTSSHNFPLAQPADSTFGGVGEAFVTKLSPDGRSLLYSTYLGGSAPRADEGRAIAVDQFGNAYVGGQTSSSDFPTTSTAFQPTFAGGLSDGFVTVLNRTGQTLYSTYLGGNAGANQILEAVDGIAVDQFRQIYVTGLTDTTNFPTRNAFQLMLRGPMDAFVTKFGTEGRTLVYSTYLGGAGSDAGSAIAADQAGHAYITGQTESSNFPTRTPFQAALAGTADAFVTKFAPDGRTLVYSTYLGGGGNGDGGMSIAVDSGGSASIVGTTNSTNFPTKDPLQPAGGAFDAFITRLTSAGTALVYSTYLGGKEFETYAVGALDGAGNAYVTGLTNSSDFPLRRAFDSSFGGGDEVPDAFVAKLATAGLSDAACVTSAGPWQTRSFPAQTGVFTVTFDAAPAISKLDGVMGLSNGPATAYTSLAAIARFNNAGFIDARNGSVYAAQTSIPYSPGIVYRFRLAVNIPRHTYSIYVCAGNGVEQAVGANYAFRTEQQSVSTLNVLKVYASTGSVMVCRVTVGP